MRWAGLAFLLATSTGSEASAQEFFQIETPIRTFSIDASQVVDVSVAYDGGTRDFFVNFDPVVSKAIELALADLAHLEVPISLCGEKVPGFAYLRPQSTLHVTFPDSDGSLERANAFISTLTYRRCE